MIKLRNYIFQFIILLVSFFFSFILVEISSRIFLSYNNRKDFYKVKQYLPVLNKGQVVTLGEIIQPSQYTKMIYELRPNINVTYENKTVETNSKGWRTTKEFSLTKEANTIRIIGIGDSFMFGQGVDLNDTALSFLEKNLNEMFPKKKWEIINAAVSGYNTAMEVETLQRKGLVFKPDIVIMEIIGNDFDLPNFIYEPDNYFALNKSFIIEVLVNRCRLSKDNFKLFDAPFDPALNSFERNPEKVPLLYKDMVGWSGFVKSMHKLKELQENNKFTVVICQTSSVFNEKIDSFCKGLGFYTIFNFFDWVEDISLVVSEKDRHPNAKQNEKTAKNILNYMIEYGIIKRFL